MKGAFERISSRSVLGGGVGDRYAGGVLLKDESDSVCRLSTQSRDNSIMLLSLLTHPKIDSRSIGIVVDVAVGIPGFEFRGVSMFRKFSRQSQFSQPLSSISMVSVLHNFHSLSSTATDCIHELVSRNP